MEHDQHDLLSVESVLPLFASDPSNPSFALGLVCTGPVPLDRNNSACSTKEAMPRNNRPAENPEKKLPPLPPIARLPQPEAVSTDKTNAEPKQEFYHDTESEIGVDAGTTNKCQQCPMTLLTRI